MITVRCPSCQAEVRGPESIVGKRVRCKRDDCRNVFVFEPPPPPPPAPVDDPWEREASALASSSYEDEFDDDESFDELPSPLPKRKKKKTAETSEQRYPLLNKYLEWCRSFAQIVLVLYLIGAAITVLGGIAVLLFSDAPSDTRLASVAFAICVGTGAAIVGYIVYVVLMASIQFVHVIIDIEKNTRRLAGKAE
ncbi:hypothetical protein Mal4_35440 [Maioricimonas rarisocia]|uniref:Zinc finger/thioredoxin putative domain-containing protein n=1 Tax=Maioricimonas rarisocia TaxID=2528026 RepID=A0A517Z9P5_9PLAN|nr:hypothetical protein [Maioricimonas rarisocia]QDU39207.1 hypothetical protein Mal4_35440 [Maioricimonas rarisocia]